jgi:xylulokinase
MEGVAFSLLDGITYLKNKGINVGNCAYIIGGGAKSKVWRQIVADALNLTLIQTETNDSSFGSAMCAGIYVGFFKDLDDASKTCQKVIGETKPIPVNTEKYEEIFIRNLQVFADTVTAQDLELIPLSEFPESWNASESFQTPSQNL